MNNRDKNNKPTYQELEKLVLELEEKLQRHKKAEERLTLAMEAIQDGVWDFNLETGEVYFSSGYYTMLGYDPGEMPACRKTWISLLHPDDRVKTVQEVDAYIRQNKNWGVEFRLRTKSGDYRWIIGRGNVVVRNEKGEPVRRVGTHTDITARKEAELEREILISDLKKAMEEVKTLSGMLPICSSCKNIRDDSGYWNRIEEYIEERSQASFSHGICPACMESLYGDQDWYEEMKKK